MSSINSIEESEAFSITKALLIDSYYSGFSCNNDSFTLKFDRQHSAKYISQELPRNINFVILTDFYFGTRKEWSHIVNRLQDNLVVEPLQPVLAHQLNSLLWMEDSYIVDLKLDSNNLDLIFMNGKSISVSLNSKMDYAWFIESQSDSPENSSWSITCDYGTLHYKHPIF